VLIAKQLGIAIVVAMAFVVLKVCLGVWKGMVVAKATVFAASMTPMAWTHNCLWQNRFWCSVECIVAVVVGMAVSCLSSW